MSQEEKLREINHIVQQLQLLSIQQTELIDRLDRLTKEERQVTKPPTAASKPKAAIKLPPTERELAIGDRVHIDNPRLLQATSGKVTKITPTRVTVTADNGTKIVRAAKNLTLERK